MTLEARPPCFESLLDAGFRPFAFGAAANLKRLRPSPLGVDLDLIPAEGAAALRWHRCLWRMNQHAYGGMGMPAWVQLDCCVLPSAFVGWSRRAADLPAELRGTIDPEAEDHAFLPVAESLSVPTAERSTWMSVSLCAVLPGWRLGLSSKTLALAAYGCPRTLGVAQYDNASLGIHTRFGPLRLRQARVPFHDKADRTFVYELDLRDPEVLTRALGVGAAAMTPDRWIDPGDTSAIAELEGLVAAGIEVRIAPPGRVLEGTRVRVPITVGTRGRRPGGPNRRPRSPDGGAPSPAGVQITFTAKDSVP